MTDLQADAGFERLMRLLFPDNHEWRTEIHRNNSTAYSWVVAIAENNPDQEPPEDDL